mmetsp:Transcript_25898/g.53826  ORF Transcript_25898/g.53826 Transcript_25898/m.53826 type:complete len:235 (+) Transcript_25898:374-1078(+)
MHRALQGLRQLRRDDHGAIGVVALPYIQQARQASQGAQIQVVQAELAAAQGQNDGILGSVVGQIGEVAAGGFRAIATSDDEDVFQSAALDGRHDLICNAQHCSVSKANLQLLPRNESAACGGNGGVIKLLSLLDQVGKIVVHYPGQLLKTHGATSPNPLAVLSHGRHQAVRSHQNGAREVSELLLLVAPMRAVVALEVCELLQIGIGMRRQHLPMGVDVDSFALTLFQHSEKHR